MSRPRLVVFTDLDGTLLDRATYSWETALPALERVKKEGIPVVFCSSKTRAEQEVYRNRLGIVHPFIVENGGAIFILRDYFPFTFDYQRESGDFVVIELGLPYTEVRRRLDKVRAAAGIHRFRGYGDMSAAEVASETGLDIESAGRAKQREYDETVVFDGDGEVAGALAMIKAAGLNYAHGGHCYDVMGASDKGIAVTILSRLYRRQWAEIRTVGLGDSLNDLPMLAAVDVPVLVQKKDGTWEEMEVPNLRKVHGIGPEGWSRAVEELLDAEMI